MNSQPNRRVLVIDDLESIHSDFQKVLAPAAHSQLNAAALSLFGPETDTPSVDTTFELAFASQGLEGLELQRAALAAGAPYAVAFVDVRMPPGLDGIETIVRLWEIDPRLEVVICTAYSDYTWQQMLQKLSRHQQFLVLEKPFNPTSVKQLALALSEKWNLARAAERTNEELEARVAQRTSELVQANSRLLEEMRERAELERRLRHAQKLEAIGRLVAGVAHEINNPLGFVLSSLEHLSQEISGMAHQLGEKGAELVTVAQEARQGGRRIAQIVKDLKEFSSPGTPTIEDVDVRETLEFALRMAGAAFPPFLQIVRDCQPVPTVRAASGRLSQIFLNLLVNSAQAMGSVPGERRRLEVAIRQDCEDVVVTIKDCGIGIRPDDLTRVFDPFFSTRPRNGGTGLGLSICHGLIHEMGGDISLESRFGEGTTATVVFPIKPAQPRKEPHGISCHDSALVVG